MAGYKVKPRVNHTDDIIAICKALPYFELPDNPEHAMVFGYHSPGGYLVAAITDYNGTSCEVSGMAKGKWFHTSIYVDLFGYIFDDLKCKRINFVVDKDNHKCINLLERGGCVFECELRGVDRLLYSMTEQDFREHYGQTIRKSVKTA